MRIGRTIAGLVMALMAGSAGAVTLSVTPSSTSNTYSGLLTLQAGGLTNGEQVIVQRYLDRNGNSLIDAGEPLIDTFRISDGGVSTIGGVTNLNVPYDSNPSGGAVTTTFSFAINLDALIGQQIFRVVSPFGNFAPQTSIVAVTNTGFGQFVSGTVYDGAGIPVPNAVVVALAQPNSDFAAGIVADNAGNYVLKLSPGMYGVFPVLPNYYTDQSLAAMVTLTNGGSATANLFLTNGSGSYTVSGQISDATNGATLGGVFMQFESGDLFAIGFSDSNGSYSAALNSSFWRIKVEGERLARRAYVVPQDRAQVDVTTGSVASVNFALPKANALFYGRLTDNLNVPFANLDFYSQDNSEQFRGDGFSDANGYYVAAVFASGTNQWNSSPSTDNQALAGYIVSSGFGTTNISPGQALHQDFVALRATAQISGRLRDNLGNDVGNININGNATIGGVQYSTYSTTDNSGNYYMPAAAGVWYVYANCCGNEGLESQGLFDPGSHSVSIPPTNAVLDITVYPTGTPLLSQPWRISPTQFGFNLNGSLGANYTVKGSTDLRNWFTVLSVNLTSNPMYIQDNQATNSQRFYRVQKD
jgi:hypothetical protein